MAKNCRDYCRYAQFCTKYYPNIKGEDNLSDDDCPMAWKIEDLLHDAEYEEEEHEQADNCGEPDERS